MGTRRAACARGARCDAGQVQACFVDWTASRPRHTGDIVAIDGKTLCRTDREGGKNGAIHMVSAWSARQEFVLEQTRTAQNPNEMTAIPDLLDQITLKGAVVTIDASVWFGRPRLPAGSRNEYRQVSFRRATTSAGQLRSTQDCSVEPVSVNRIITALAPPAQQPSVRKMKAQDGISPVRPRYSRVGSVDRPSSPGPQVPSVQSTSVRNGRPGPLRMGSHGSWT